MSTKDQDIELTSSAGGFSSPSASPKEPPPNKKGQPTGEQRAHHEEGGESSFHPTPETDPTMLRLPNAYFGPDSIKSLRGKQDNGTQDGDTPVILETDPRGKDWRGSLQAFTGGASVSGPAPAAITRTVDNSKHRIKKIEDVDFDLEHVSPSEVGVFHKGL